MKEVLNKMKYFIVPIVLLFVMVLITGISYANTELRESVTISSEHANYYNEENNSWELYKTARWINATEAEIEINVHSRPNDPIQSDYIYLVDLNNGASLRALRGYLLGDTSPYTADQTYNISIIGFDEYSAEIYATQETNTENIDTAIDNMNGVAHYTENVDYYLAIKKLEELLNNFEYTEGRNVKAIFISYPYEGVNKYNQKAELDYFREAYPNVELYFVNTGDIADVGFLSDEVAYVGNDISLVTSANVINEFAVTDVIDTTYFEYEEVIESTYKNLAYSNCSPSGGGGSEIPAFSKGLSLNPKLLRTEGCYCEYQEYPEDLSSSGLISNGTFLDAKKIGSIPFNCKSNYIYNIGDTVEYDEETNKITWNLSNSIYSKDATLKLKVKLKDEYINSNDKFTTNESTKVESNLYEIEENVSTNNSPELKYHYTITYEGNMPEGCTWTNVTESHVIYSNNTTLEAPICNGYKFKGWVTHDLPTEYTAEEIEEEYNKNSTYYDIYGLRIGGNIFYSLEDVIAYYTKTIKHPSESYEMIPKDITFTGTWSKLNINKRTQGIDYNSLKITGIVNKKLTGASEVSNPTYTRNTTTTSVELDTLTSVAEYTVTVANLTDSNYRIEVDHIENDNPNIEYEIVEKRVGLEPNSSTTFTIRIKYKDNVTALPDNKTDNLTITYKYVVDGAMFKTGKEVNTKMKQFINSTSYFNNTDGTITNIARYEGIPDSSYLIEANIVSVENDIAQDPIYMWYDSENTTIYWYSESANVYYNYDSSDFYANLSALNSISCMNDISSEYVTNMSYMFYETGYNSTIFTLDLGNKFDTSNVTTMYAIFSNTGYNSSVFTLDLGDKFDTSNVTDMASMFASTGYNSPVFTLDLGDNFDTSNVTYMEFMFSSIGHDSTAFTLDLGDKFDTSNVINMEAMFYSYNGTTIYAPSIFVTSSVTSSKGMFTGCTNLVGGLGTVYDSSHIDAAYAHIDGGTSNPGYFTLRKEAMFDTGKNVNTKMKQYVNSSATYNTSDTTITNIARYTDTPDSSYLIDANKVSTTDSEYPIYMWYDSSNTTIYWYSEANFVYYNPDSSYFFYNLRAINSISNMSDISSEYVTTMESMFQTTGYSSSSFTLDLGDKFDTSKVTKMTNMFYHTGYSSTIFTLDLGNKFDTSNVTNMQSMFNSTGYSNTVFTLDLGDKFDTSNVTNMSFMFSSTGRNSTVFTLDLGDKFDTGNVTNMYYVFGHTGYKSTVFTLDLGHKFDTSNVTDMAYMFFNTGYSSTSFTLDLGDRFDTSNVTDMQYMFYDTGQSSIVFTLDLGEKFDTGNVTTMYYMFGNTGYKSTVFTLDLGDKFDTSNVTNMYAMFQYTGYSSTVFTLDLGDKFDTSNVANMSYMFSCTGRNSTAFTLDLGDKFDTSNVTNMSYMFQCTGYSSTSFTLDLGDKFDTSKVTNMNSMFYAIGYSSTVFTLDLGNLFDTSSVTDMASMFYNFKGTTIYAPSTFVTDSVTISTNMFNGCTNLVGGLGTVYDSSHIDAAYAHIDGGPSNPGYFSAKGAKIATIYYNSNTTSGGLTVSQAKTYCVPASGSTSCIITVPSEATSSVGKYNSAYKGVSTSTGNMGSSSLTISENTTYYANYSSSVTNYYYGSSYTSRTLYRNEYFSSTSDMESKLATSNTGTSNYSTAVGPGSSVWTGLSTGADTTQEYTSVQAAANSNSGTLYTVYTFNVTYAKGANVSAIGSTSGSCKVTSSSTSCSVTLPSITPNTNYGSVGWSTTNGATSGTAAGASMTIGNNGVTLYGNAARLYTCPVSRTATNITWGGYSKTKYGSYQSECTSSYVQNSLCGQTQTGTYDTCNWTPRCPDEGSCYDVHDENGNRTMTCCTCPEYTTNSCNLFNCPNSLTYSYTFGEAQFNKYGSYQDQCK